MHLIPFLWICASVFTYGFIRDGNDPWFMRAAYAVGALLLWPLLLGIALQRKMNRR